MRVSHLLGLVVWGWIILTTPAVVAQTPCSDGGDTGTCAPACSGEDRWGADTSACGDTNYCCVSTTSGGGSTQTECAAFGNRCALSSNGCSTGERETAFFSCSAGDVCCEPDSSGGGSGPNIGDACTADVMGFSGTCGFTCSGNSDSSSDCTGSGVVCCESGWGGGTSTPCENLGYTCVDTSIGCFPNGMVETGDSCNNSSQVCCSAGTGGSSCNGSCVSITGGICANGLGSGSCSSNQMCCAPAPLPSCADTGGICTHVNIGCTNGERSGAAPCGVRQQCCAPTTAPSDGSGGSCSASGILGACQTLSYCQGVGRAAGASSLCPSTEYCCLYPTTGGASGGGTPVVYPPGSGIIPPPGGGPIVTPPGGGTACTGSTTGKAGFCKPIANCAWADIDSSAQCTVAGQTCCASATSGTGTGGTVTATCPTGWSTTGGTCFPPSGSNGLSSKTIEEILINLMNWLLGIFGIIAIIGFIISGLQYLFSAGDEGVIETAKRNMKYSLIGIAVALSGYIMILAINNLLNASSTI